MDHVLLKWKQLERKVFEYHVEFNDHKLSQLRSGDMPDLPGIASGIQIKIPLSQAGKAYMDAESRHFARHLCKREANDVSYPSLQFRVEVTEQGNAFLTSLLVEFWSAGEGATGLYPMLITPKTTVAFLHSWFDNCIEPFSVEAEFVQPAHDAIELYVKMARDILSMSDQH